MWSKVSCLRKQHDGRDWASNHQPSDLKSNALTTTTTPPPPPHDPQTTITITVKITTACVVGSTPAQFFQ